MANTMTRIAYRKNETAAKMRSNKAVSYEIDSSSSYIIQMRSGNKNKNPAYLSYDGMATGLPSQARHFDSAKQCILWFMRNFNSIHTSIRHQPKILKVKEVWTCEEVAFESPEFGAEDEL